MFQRKIMIHSSIKFFIKITFGFRYFYYLSLIYYFFLSTTTENYTKYKYYACLYFHLVPLIYPKIVYS